MKPKIFKAWSNVTHSFAPGENSINDWIVLFTKFGDKALIEANMLTMEFIEWTGEVDIHKKKIFQDDIIKIKVKNEFGSVQDIVGQVVWDQKLMGWTVNDNTPVVSWVNIAEDECEVLGNIRENADILTKTVQNLHKVL